MNTIFLRPVLQGLLWLLFLFSAASGAVPTINWTPPSVTQKVSTGQTITVPVTFTASENISNAVVRVVPALVPFVATNPSSYASIPKGQTVTLTLTISAAASSPIGTFEGTIQLKSGGKSNTTFAKPLPVTITVTDMSPEQKIQSLEDQGDIPKLDRSSDIQGPDVNANGIRDDVEAYIATHYTSPPQRAAAEQFARVIETAMFVDKTDAAALKAVSLKSSKAVHCIYDHFDVNAGAKHPAAVIEEIESISTSTKARLLAYLAYSKALDGKAGSVPEGDTCE